MTEMWKSVVIQTTFITKSLFNTTCFNCAARTAMLFCITKALKRQEYHGHTMEIRISVFIQTPLSNAYPIFVMVYSWDTTRFRCAARTMTAVFLATALIQKNHVEIRRKCGNRFGYKHHCVVHIHSWSWSLCVVPRVSIPMPQRQRCFILQQRSTNRNYMNIRWTCWYRFLYKHKKTVHTHSWSWSFCSLPRVSIALRRRWRRFILQQGSTKKITWTYDGNVETRNLF